jgi:hypothetical protein
MSRVSWWFGGCLALVLVSAASAEPRYIVPGVDPVGAGGFRADRFELRLRPEAAATARVAMARAARFAPQGVRPATTSLGLSAIDRVAAGVGVVRFEP